MRTIPDYSEEKKIYAATLTQLSKWSYVDGEWKQEISRPAAVRPAFWGTAWEIQEKILCIYRGGTTLSVAPSGETVVTGLSVQDFFHRETAAFTLTPAELKRN